MPTLLELERAVSRAILADDDTAAAAHIVAGGLAPQARLGIHRTAFTANLTRALELCYPAVRRLVGAEFFTAAARIFIPTEPPRRADLDMYGAGFPDFLTTFPSTATLPYLPGVAELEWAVNRALHAPDGGGLDLGRLGDIANADHDRVAFLPDPSLTLVAAEHQADAIRQAVLAQDVEAMAAIDLGAGPVHLLVERRSEGIRIARLAELEWRFAAALCASWPLGAAIAAVPEADAVLLLAEHLAAGRFVGFALVGNRPTRGADRRTRSGR